MVELSVRRVRAELEVAVLFLVQAHDDVAHLRFDGERQARDGRGVEVERVAVRGDAEVVPGRVRRGELLQEEVRGRVGALERVEEAQIYGRDDTGFIPIAPARQKLR